MNKQSRWPISLAIVGAVVIASAALILSNRPLSVRIALQATRDGAGNVIVAWRDRQGINVQKIGLDGKLLWANGKVLEGTNPERAGFLKSVGDGQGGAIIAWEDRSGLPSGRKDLAYIKAYSSPIPVYAQRLSASGETLWGKGVPAGAVGAGGFFCLLSDGSGGAFIAWNDFEPVHMGLHNDYYRIQRIDPQGNAVWGEGILACCSQPWREVTPEERERGIGVRLTRSMPECGGFHLVGDDSGGVVACWEMDYSASTRVYAQRYDAKGRPVWPEGGVLAFDTSREGRVTSVTGDGSGGAIIVGSDVRRIDSEGRVLWPPGIRISFGRVISDGRGGVVFSWQETERVYPWTAPQLLGESALHVRRLDGEGRLQWSTEPLLTTAKGQTLGSVIADDGSGGVLAGWVVVDHMVGTTYTQKLDANGKPQWGEKGVKVFPDVGLRYQSIPQVVSDGYGGAIILAVVGKKALNGDLVYAQRLDVSGNPLWGDGIRVSR